MMTDVQAPTAGQILGAVVDALELGPVVDMMGSEPLLGSRTARRFFNQGTRPRSMCCLISAVATGLMSGMVFPHGCAEHGHDVHQLLHSFVSASLNLTADAWDTLVKKQRVDASTRRALLRLATVDLAIKASHARDSNTADIFDVADWCQLKPENLIRRLRKRHGWTIEQMAGVIGVERNTILNWQRGRRPSGDNLVRLSAAVVVDNAADVVNRDKLLATYRGFLRHYAMCKLARAVAELEGRPFVEECAKTFREALTCNMATLKDRGHHGAFHPVEVIVALLPWVGRERYEHVALAHGATPEWGPDVVRALDLLGIERVAVDGDPMELIRGLMERAAKLHARNPVHRAPKTN